jgi:hypothetical protein
VERWSGRVGLVASVMGTVLLICERVDFPLFEVV